MPLYRRLLMKLQGWPLFWSPSQGCRQGGWPFRIASAIWSVILCRSGIFS